MDPSNAPACTSIEADRLSALLDLEILDTPAERDFDEITRVAATALAVESSAVSLIDDERQWFKSRHGIPFPETPRNIAFCTHAVASREIVVVPDASRDGRFLSNPLVTQEGRRRRSSAIWPSSLPTLLSRGAFARWERLLRGWSMLPRMQCWQ